MIGRPASLPWLAHHELRLVWRDWVRMMTGGKRRRAIVLVIVLTIFAVALHIAVYPLVATWPPAGSAPDKRAMVLITGGGLLFFTMMLSQAMESVTRAYYARSDLDLMLASPASPRRLFAVRTAAIALSTVALACLLASPIVDILLYRDGPRWLAAFGVLAAMAAFSTALAIVATVWLFRVVGAKRTRVLAQVLAAVIGAGFAIGIQAAAILAYGNMSRFALMQSDTIIALAPDPENLLWVPARAAMGDGYALAWVLFLGFGSLCGVIAFTASSFARHAIAAAGVSETRARVQRRDSRFRRLTQKHTLRLKEWKLLQRDPWLMSQILMQILYLVPPALLLWVYYGEGSGVLVVVAPVLVMAAGQLAGGLAWLAISGEDAHDLIVSAPVPARAALAAKIEAVAWLIAAVLAPLIVLLAFSSLWIAAVTAIGAALATVSATAIQLWFRTPTRRSMFRRRQVASRAATISEALTSVMWAAAAGLIGAASAISFAAILPATGALIVLAVARAISPRESLAPAGR
jgi:ABC-2 type transport system permease protein